MAQEHRQIILSHREALLALDAHRRAAAGFLPGGELVGFHLKPDGDLAITVRMIYGKTAQEVTIDYKLADIAPVLQQFCTENNLQVPAVAKKFVRCDSDSLALVIITEI